ncbi:MAG: pantoate--beta-alanine ligase [Aquificaceae bacterium]|nr:MAG: pantoate--beta-alanine ligase [Aquificaceae bacterium]
MYHISEISPVREKIKKWKQAGYRIAFVPTMGNLHAGHLALVERAKELADKVVVSIFVNPIQFDKKVDLQAYPRTLVDDKAKLLSVECDLVFTPSVKVLYPSGSDITRVEVSGISELLEGESRPGHFSGVATVVTKLFNIVSPDVSIFGEKDFQQLMLVRKMVKDLDMDIDIIGLPTVRDPDGLAMSSRNSYLTAEERKIAPQFYKEMKFLAESLKKGATNFQSLQLSLMSKLEKIGFKPDYIEIRKANDLTVASEEDVEIVILGSAWLGKARLIDNIVMTV